MFMYSSTCFTRPDAHH